MKFSVYGAGAWGTTMAIHLNNSGHSVTLIPRRSEHANEINQAGENAHYLPGFSVEGIAVSADLTAGLEADVAFIACPSKGLQGLAQSLKPLIQSDKSPVFLSLCKGLDTEKFLTPCQFLEQELGQGVTCGVLSGPNLASEIAQGKPAASTLAIPEASNAHAEAIQAALSNERLRVYLSTDRSGVEFASCLKNVYAIGAGIIEGLSLGYNAKSSYLTRALAELLRIGTGFGGSPETFYGLSGFGDLVATCSSPSSRNFSFGTAITAGKSPKDVIDAQDKVVEGYRSTKAFYDHCKDKAVDAPILEQLYAVLYQGVPIQEAVSALMSRELKSE